VRIEKVLPFQAVIKTLKQTRSAGLTGFNRDSGVVSKKDPENHVHPVKKTYLFIRLSYLCFIINQDRPDGKFKY
jgi:hypothetical protein